MKTGIKILFIFLLAIAIISACTIYVMSNQIAVLDPKGMISIEQKDLLITASLLMLIVVIPVFAFAIFFSWKYRSTNKDAKHTPDWEHNTIAELCWWGVPLLVIVILGLITWKTTHDLNPFKPIENGKRPLRIQAVALRWKWLFIYPEQGIATINYTQFPEKIPLDFEITADAPMNSFWIPQLGGQIYAMPAMRSEIHLIANEKGTFSGKSANYSGPGFAGMNFTAVASSEDEFSDWVQSVRSRGSPLNFNIYEKLVEPSEYDPVSYYTLEDPDLFFQILEKYGPEYQQQGMK